MNKEVFAVACSLVSCFTILSAQTITLYDPSTGAALNEGSGAHIPNTIQFKVANLLPPEPDPESNRASRWQYFWDFGDCSYPSTERSPVHTYPAVNASYEVSLTLTPIYSGEEEELPEVHKPIAVTGPLNNPPAGEEAKVEFKAGKNIGIINIRDCKPGDLNTFLVPFENTTGATLNSGQLQFTYPANLLTFDEAYLNECGYDPPYTHYLSQHDTIGTFTFDFSGIAPDEQRFIAITLLTNTNAEIGTRVPLVAQWYDGLSTLMSDDTLLLEVVNSHDPNRKSVFRGKSCVFDSLRYTIQFENEGTADAGLVYVIDHIDPLLDMESFSMISTTHGSLPVPINDSLPIDSNFNPYFLDQDEPLSVVRDIVNRKLAFVFHEIHLPPGGEGALSYLIALVSSNIPVNTEFGSHADIYFDDNPPIATNPAISRVSNCYCLPGGITPESAWIDEIGLNGLNNKSGHNGGYGYYRHLSTALTAGEEYELTLHPGYVDVSMPCYWSVAMDMDQDGSFASDEVVYIETENGVVETILDIPSDAISGETVMRIIVSTDADPFACGDELAGEMEDYTIHIVQPSLPDLVPLKPVLTKRIPPGAGLLLAAPVHNSGPADVPAGVTVAYFLSQDPVPGPGDLLLAQNVLPSVPALQTVTNSVVITVPEGYSGTYYILVVADPEHVLEENLETNNILGIQCYINPLLPDLALSGAFTCETQMAPGRLFRFSCTVENKGDVAVFAGEPGNALKLYLSADEVIDAFDVPVAYAEMETIFPGQEIAFSLSDVLPPAYVNGYYHLIAKIDADDDCDEYMENNNTVYAPVYLASDQAATLPYYTGFECGAPDVYWVIPDLSTNSISVPFSAASFAGYHHLLLGSDETDVRYIDLLADLFDEDPVTLSFRWKDLNLDFESVQDGVFFSDDGGATFLKLHDLSGNDYWNWASIPLSDMVYAAGLELTGNAIIRFQKGGSANYSSNGLALDELALVSGYMSSKGGCSGCPSPSGSLQHRFLNSPLEVYPNPFDNSTTIYYRAEHDQAPLEVSIYTLTGQEVAVPVPYTSHRKGAYQQTFSGETLPDGVYLCILRTDREIITSRMVISR